MRAVLVVGLLALGACASPIRPYTAPDGRQAYGMECGKGLTRCYDKAHELCGGNYEVIDRISGVAVSGTAGQVSSSRDDRLYVACKTA